MIVLIIVDQKINLCMSKQYKFKDAKRNLEEFAKIIIADGKQVVVMKSFDAEEDRDILRTVTSIDGVQAEAKFGFVSTVSRNEAFDKYEYSNAKDFIEGTKKLISESA